MPRKKSSTPQRKGTPRKSVSKNVSYRVGNKIYKLNKATIREIRRLQMSTQLCIPKLPFSRVIREILMQYAQIDMKVQRKALDALQEAAEMYLTQLFEDSNLCAHHAKRLTLRPPDMRLALTIRGTQDPGFL